MLEGEGRYRGSGGFIFTLTTIVRGRTEETRIFNPRTHGIVQNLLYGITEPEQNRSVYEEKRGAFFTLLPHQTGDKA